MGSVDPRGTPYGERDYNVGGTGGWGLHLPLVVGTRMLS